MVYFILLPSVFQKVALAVMLICWQQHTTMTPASSTMTFDTDEALVKDQMPLATTAATKQQDKAAEVVH